MGSARKLLRPPALIVLALLGAVAGVLVGVASGGGESRPERPPDPGRPNVLLILTDDMRTGDLAHMPHTKRLLADRGTTFPNLTTTTPTCCPSRATFLRGQYAHNHRVGFLDPPREATFRERGLDGSTAATWLHDAGYRTGYLGKYLNGYGVRRVPPGWDRWYANFGPDVWARTFNVGGKPKTKETGNLDVHLGRLGAQFAANGRRSFLLIQNFNAPHQRLTRPPPAPKRDLRAFAGVRAPRSPAFNRVSADMPRWVASRPRLRPRQIRELNAEHRARLASLQVVDRAVRRMVRTLRDSGELDDTYIMFTSDNGYHMGERRTEAGKMTPWLDDVRVPLIVRGPGVEKGAVRDELVQSTDIAPTLAEIAGAPTPDFVDGRSIVPLLEGRTPPWRRASLFEGRGPNVNRVEVKFSGLTTANGRHYVEYPDGTRELYDIDADPHQLENLAAGPDNDAEVARLSERLASLRECAGETCREVEDGP